MISFTTLGWPPMNGVPESNMAESMAIFELFTFIFEKFRTQYDYCFTG